MNGVILQKMEDRWVKNRDLRKDTLEKIKIFNTPLKLSGRTHIEKSFMYIS